MSSDRLNNEQRAFLVRHLTPSQLAVVHARIDGHSWQRIANAMNLDEATVRGHHKRATRRLNNATRTKEDAA